MKPLSSDERYQELAEKWLNKSINPQEREEFAQWYNSGQDNDINLPKDFAGNDQELKKRIFSGINKNISNSVIPSAYKFQRWFAAAAIITVVFSAGIYFYSDNKVVDQFVAKQSNTELKLAAPSPMVTVVPEKQKIRVTEVKDIEAGENKAILTLGDGSKIILDDAQNGILANQGGNSILKTAEGELIYSFSNETSNQSAERKADNIIFNTIETPKGSKFQVILPGSG